MMIIFFFFKQKTAYEMRISDWISDVCSSDLKVEVPPIGGLSLTRADITKYTPRFSSTLALSWVLPVRPFDSEVAFNTDYYHTEKFGAQNGQNLPGDRKSVV